MLFRDQRDMPDMVTTTRYNYTWPIIDQSNVDIDDHCCIINLLFQFVCSVRCPMDHCRHDDKARKTSVHYTGCPSCCKRKAWLFLLHYVRNTDQKELKVLLLLLYEFVSFTWTKGDKLRETHQESLYQVPVIVRTGEIDFDGFDIKYSLFDTGTDAVLRTDLKQVDPSSVQETDANITPASNPQPSTLK